MASRRRLIATQTSHVDSNGMITDSWDTFIKNVKSGNARKYYNLGNYIPLDLGTHGLLNMEIIAFDPTWLREDLEGYPNIALFSKECLNDVFTGADIVGGDYGSGFLKPYKVKIPTFLPDWLKSEIVPVYKPDGGMPSASSSMYIDTTYPAYPTWSLSHGYDVFKGLINNSSSEDKRRGMLDLNRFNFFSENRYRANGENTPGWAILGGGIDSGKSYVYYIPNGTKPTYLPSKEKLDGTQSYYSISIGYPLGFCL